MKSKNRDLPSADDADAALAEIADDQRALVREFTRTGAWYYPAGAALAAIVVWATAVDSLWQLMVVWLLCVVGYTRLGHLREGVSGVTMSWPGRRGLVIWIPMFAGFAAIFTTSFVFVFEGRAAYALPCAAVAFVLMFVGAWLQDVNLRFEVTDIPGESSFDPEIHAPERFRLCAVLRHVDAVSFGSLVKLLGISETQLSGTIRSLAKAGYVTVDKSPSGGRHDFHHTADVHIADLGRRAYDGHVAALREIIAQRPAQ